jgi:hypothetical protein
MLSPRHLKFALSIAVTCATSACDEDNGLASGIVLPPAVAQPSPSPSTTPSPTATSAASGFMAVQQFRGLFAPLNIDFERAAFELELKTNGETDVHVVRNEIAVNGHSGWHTHPGPSLVTVTVGEVTVYDADDPLCAPKRFTAGQGFVDLGGGDIHLIRNESMATAETVAVQFLPRNATRREGATRPSQCPASLPS